MARKINSPANVRLSNLQTCPVDYLINNILIYQWRTISRSPLSWASRAKEATSPYSEMPSPKGISRSRGSPTSSKSQHRPGPRSPTRSSPSTPSIVSVHLVSRVGRPDALPRDRQDPLLGLRRRPHRHARNWDSTQFFYSYNYNVFTTNIRYRTFRNVFPFFIAYVFADAYSSYRKQILKVNLFDEYCYLRANELVKQNEYMLDHPGTYFTIKTSSALSGGLRTSRKLWERSIGKPTTTLPLISRILNWSFKISSTDTLIPTPRRPCKERLPFSDRDFRIKTDSNNTLSFIQQSFVHKKYFKCNQLRTLFFSPLFGEQRTARELRKHNESNRMQVQGEEQKLRKDLLKTMILHLQILTPLEVPLEAVVWDLLTWGLSYLQLLYPKLFKLILILQKRARPQVFIFKKARSLGSVLSRRSWLVLKVL